MTKRKVEAIEDLRPDPRNANQGSERGHRIIEQSVRQRGAGRSGLAAKDGTMIAGSQTLQKMAELGIPVRTVHTNGDEWVVVVRDDIEPGSEEATLLGLEDNRATDVGLVWDATILEELGKEVDLSGLFSVDELAELSSSSETAAGGGGDEQVSIDESKPTRCQPGDIWRIGSHIVACLDSTEPGNIDRALDGRTPQMVWADPPYGIDIVAADVPVGGGEKYNYPFGGVKGKNHRTAAKGTIGGDKPFGSRPVVGTVGADHIVRAGRYAPVIGDESTETARVAVRLCFAQFKDAIQVWWGANNYADELPPSTCWLVWDKENTGNFADAELAWCSHPSAVRIFKHMWNGMLRASEHGRRVHPTQKPIALCEWAFEKYGSVGDVILDPFLGSGPSIKAAHKTNRIVVGFELSPHYVDHILEWAEAEGLTVERVNN